MASAAKQLNDYRTYGNVAYQPAGAPARRREAAPESRPLVRPREGVRARPRAAVREAGHVSIFAVVGFLAVGVCAILMLMSYVRLMQVSDHVDGLRRELTKLEEEHVHLLTKYELAYDLKAIEQSLTESGRMVKPQSGQIVMLDLSAPDSVVVFGAQEKENPFAGIWAGIQDTLFGWME